ncbi:MmyB family transcriptional regulator [Streptomyces sp. NBC_00443]|uniref:MmyB family transcriptional regulator n=1 Tax=Streptomyces sp. NBC_00443 TaxID=2975743 RepID=UPI002E229457
MARTGDEPVQRHRPVHERTYLFDLAQAAQPPSRTPRRRKAVDIPPRVQWLLDSMTLSAVFVTNGRLDIVGTNALARALFAPLFESESTDNRGRPNFARYWFLNRGAPDFVADWDGALGATVALLRAEAGSYPHDKALRELIGELSTTSPEFRTRWAAQDVRIHHGGVKQFQHPDAGPLELVYQPLDLPISLREVHSLTIYTAEPDTPDEERLKLLASWAATRLEDAEPVGDRDLPWWPRPVGASSVRRAGGWPAPPCRGGRTSRPARRGEPIPGSLPAGR